MSISTALHSTTAIRRGLSETNAVRDVVAHAKEASRKHWWPVEKIIKYLKYTRTQGLTVEKGRGLDLVAYSDSDCAGDEEDRHSVSEGAVMCAEPCAPWFSRTQRCATTSSTEAEL